MEKKLSADRTWGNMKIHFTTAHKAMKEFSSATASSAGFTEDHANSIAQQVANRLRVEEPQNDANVMLIQTINILQEQMANMQTVLDHQAQAVTPPTVNTGGSQFFQNQPNQGGQQNFQQQIFQNRNNQNGNGNMNTRRGRNNCGNQQNWQNNRNPNNNNNWSQNNWT